MIIVNIIIKNFYLKAQKIFVLTAEYAAGNQKKGAKPTRLCHGAERKVQTLSIKISQFFYP